MLLGLSPQSHLSLLLCLTFPPSCERHHAHWNVNIQTNSPAHNDGRARLWSQSFESAVRWGERRVGPKECKSWFRLSHWRSRRNEGNVVFGHYQRVPYSRLVPVG